MRLQGLANAGAAALIFGLFLVSTDAPAATFSTLCTFKGTCNGTISSYHPLGAVLEDTSGNIFGTAAFGLNGGSSNAGAVWKYSSGTFSEIYDFCSQTGCSDGQTPSSNLIMDVNGNLYGTAAAGGKGAGGGDGVVFELSPNGSSWTYKVLHKFCWPGNCSTGTMPDGYKPLSGLTYAGQSSGSLYDGSSTLYGTTIYGGNTDGTNTYGTVYSIKPGSGGAWTETLIYKFTVAGADGYQPTAGLVMDGSGNLYGTARKGASGAGVVYELSPSGSSWSESVLYNFCSGGGNCTDGESPDTNGLTVDPNGNLWGTTVSGGDYMFDKHGGGVVYEAYPYDGTCTPHPNWCEKVLYYFCSTGASCSDGLSPSAGTGIIITNTSPYTVYGTTSAGGADGAGVLFELSGTTYSKLYDFCQASGCSDGNQPTGGLYLDGSGTFYGVTEFGGVSTGYGTMFKYVP